MRSCWLRNPSLQCITTLMPSDVTSVGSRGLLSVEFSLLSRFHWGCRLATGSRWSPPKRFSWESPSLEFGTLTIFDPAAATMGRPTQQTGDGIWRAPQHSGKQPEW